MLLCLTVLFAVGLPHMPFVTTTCWIRMTPAACGYCSRVAGAMIIAFRGTEAFNLLNWCAELAPHLEVTAQCSTVGKAMMRRLAITPYILALSYQGAA